MGNNGTLMSEGLGIRRDGWIVLTWIGKAVEGCGLRSYLKMYQLCAALMKGIKTGFLMAVTKGEGGSQEGT